MRFNWKALIISFFGLALINSLFVIPLWYLSENYSFQFYDTADIVRLLFYLPPIIVNVTFLISIWILFNNGSVKREKLRIKGKFRSNAIATPTGDSKGGLINHFEAKRHHTLTFLLIGALLSISISFVFYQKSKRIFYTVDAHDFRKYPTRPLFSKRWIRSAKSQNLQNIANTLRNFLSESLNTKSLPPQELGKWQSIFESNLDCFETENKLYSQYLANEIEVVKPKNQIFWSKNFILTENYEYWIDSNNPKHFKIRYHKLTENELNYKPSNFGINYIAYNTKNNQFEDEDIVYPSFMDCGDYVFYSSTNRIQFEYDDSI